MKCLDLVDSFTVDTYKWQLITTSGQPPSPRHSHSAVIVNSLMFIIGGNSSHDLFLKDNTLNDIHYLDLKTYSWTSIKVTG